MSIATKYKKNRSKPSWIKRHISDQYVKSAIADGYRARSAYKLIEINNKYNILHNARIALDLGCSPGSWLQVLRRYLANDSKIIGVDILDTDFIDGVHIIKGDFTSAIVQQSLDYKFDLILSDMSPNLTGISLIDASNCLSLVGSVIQFAAHHLNNGGKCVIKYFNLAQIDSVLNEIHKLFKRVKIVKPAASRAASAECYLVVFN
jgi:23S rRNA (uridine2552-2'-O)-methyltransferase